MNVLAINKNESLPTAFGSRFWWTVVLLGGVFFFVAHNVHTSVHENYAPWSDADDVVASGGNAIKGAALLLIGALGAGFLLSKEGRRCRFDDPLAILIVLYLALAAASVAWSIDPAFTLRRVAVLFFCFVGALGLVRQFSPRELVAAAGVIMGTYFAVGLAAEIALGTFRPFAADYRFAGSLHPNGQGVQLTIFCFALFFLARHKPWRRHRLGLWALFVLGFCFLVLTKSRTTLAGFLAAMAVLSFVVLPSRDRTLAVVFGLFVVFAVLLGSAIFFVDWEEGLSSTVLLGRQSEFGALTGRLPVWEELQHYIAARPWLGYGYESFWTPQHIEDISQNIHWRFREAHNGYLEEFLSVGFVGAALLGGIVVAGIVRSWKALVVTQNPLAGLTMGMLLFSLINATLESGMASANFLTFFIGCGLVQAAFYHKTTAPHE